MTVRIANWVNQATATTGTGTMTLSTAQTGYITFGTAGIADGELVGYSIDDGANKEMGYGIYTVSGTTLSRDSITATLVAGVFDDTAPVAITLSGTATVSIRPDASTDLVGMSGVKCFNPTDKFLRSANMGIPAGTRPMLAGRTYFTQFVINGPVTINQLGAEIDTIATTGTDMKLGLYRWDGRTNTAYLVDTTATIATNGTTGKKYAVLAGGDKVIAPGFYLLAVGTDGDVALKAGTLSGNSMLPVKDITTTSQTKTLWKAGYAGTLPLTQAFDSNDVDAAFPDMFIIHA